MPEGVNPTFTVTPEEIELRPRTAVTFTFRGFSAKKGSVQEKLGAEPRRQGQERQARVQHAREGRLHRAAARVHRLAPLPARSTTRERGVPIAVQATPLTMTNRTLLPLHRCARRRPSRSTAGSTAAAGRERDGARRVRPGLQGRPPEPAHRDAPERRGQSHPHRDSIPQLARSTSRTSTSSTTSSTSAGAQRHDQDAARARDQLLKGRDRLPVGVPRRGAGGRRARAASRTSQ